MVRVFLFVLVLCFTLSSWAVYLQRLDLPSVEYGAINPFDAPARLYEGADSASRVIASLPQDAFALYLHSGQTGKWHYLRYDDRELAVYGKRVALGFVRVAERWVVSLEQVQKVSTATSLCAALLFLSLFFSRKKPVQPISQNVENVYSESEVIALRNQALYEQEQHIQQKYQQEISHKDRCNAELSAANKKMKLQLDTGFKVFVEGVKAEAKRQYEPTLMGMEKSYKELEAIHKKLKVISSEDIDNARIFDVDLRHKNLENIMKGRLFEQCIALCMQDVVGYTIKSWTPDKGFLSGVFVEANKDPDLLLSNPQGTKVAIECKYRRTPNSSEHDILWSLMRRAYDYRDYGKDNGLAVYVALGVGGNPNSPDLVYLVPISKLMERGFSYEKIIDNKKYFSTPKSLLSNWAVDLKSGEGILKRLIV